MKKIEPREGHLPEKIMHLVLNPAVRKGWDKPIEVWECANPRELLDYVEERNATYQPMAPFKDDDSGKEDTHWYMCAILVEEMTDAGIAIPCNKLLFCVASPEFLRNEANKIVEEKTDENERRRRWMR